MTFISILSVFVLAAFVAYHMARCVTPAVRTPVETGDAIRLTRGGQVVNARLLG